MANYPRPLEQRMELDSRLGIKSSLNGISSVVALGYALYCANNKRAKIVYSNEIVSQGKKQITLLDNLAKSISDFYGVTAEELNKIPLLTAQLEAIQVGFSLMFKLGVVRFVDYPNTDTKERTGGERYRKEIFFSANMNILDLYISSWEETTRKNEILAWLRNEPSNSEFSLGLKKLLTIFSEDTLYKMRADNGQDIIFQQEGIYSELMNGESVTAKDTFEDVGPFRVFKSILREDLHPYLKLKSNELFLKEEGALHDYLSLVQTSLLLGSKVVRISNDNKGKENNKVSDVPSRQTILFGTPGSGKSHWVKGKTDGKSVHRTTFHPDSDYASFVGCYKPTMSSLNFEELLERLAKEDTTAASLLNYRQNAPQLKDKVLGGEFRCNSSDISYTFTPQVFTKAYVEAWKKLKAEDIAGSELVYLVIEEINRGNCAQIFGDLFQLLDRDSEGYSDYRITADSDLRDYLSKELGKDHEGIKEGKLCLPPNLHILATMNTSDQSLFPMDSAFKRRWDWEYIPISYTEPTSSQFLIKLGEREYFWVDFLQKVNELIRKVTDSEDKQMGNFFIKGDVMEIEFKGKVMFYLWNEVCRDEYHTQNNFFRYKEEDEEREFSFNDLYSKKEETDENGKKIEKGLKLLYGFMRYLGVGESAKVVDEANKEEQEG